MTTREIYKGRVVDLRLEEVDLPNGQSVTLIRQFRHAAGGYIWEVPAGTLGPGEAPEACARRELREETGLIANAWTALGSILTTPGFCDERIHLFLARELADEVQSLDPDEVLTVTRVPMQRALEMVRSGEIDDAKSIAALHRAAVELGALQAFVD